MIEMIDTRADEAREKVGDAADQANNALEEAEAAVAPFDSQCVEVFFLIVNTGISFWSLFGYLSSELRPQGDSICMAAYITAAVQYKVSLPLRRLHHPAPPPYPDHSSPASVKELIRWLHLQATYDFDDVPMLSNSRVQHEADSAEGGLLGSEDDL